MGVTILSEFVFREGSRGGGRIRRKKPTGESPTLDIGLAREPGAPLSPVSETLRQYVRFAIDELATSGASRDLFQNLRRGPAAPRGP